MNKYKNKRLCGFDSKAEMNRWEELSLMEKEGLIEALERQKRYVLIPSQYIDGKCVERPCTYKADFVYIKDGQVIVEDVKGFKTKEYIIKRKLMLKKYGIRIKEV